MVWRRSVWRRSWCGDRWVGVQIMYDLNGNAGMEGSAELSSEGAFTAEPAQLTSINRFLIRLHLHIYILLHVFLFTNHVSVQPFQSINHETSVLPHIIFCPHSQVHAIRLNYRDRWQLQGRQAHLPGRVRHGPRDPPGQVWTDLRGLRAGVKGGLHYGATDEFGYKAVTNKVHVNDLHATLLHMLGLDHTKLTFRHAGRDFRLTDVHGNVVREVLA